MESAATGLIAGCNAARFFKGEELIVPDHYTMIGALLELFTTSTPSNFQPMNANFGIIPPLPNKIKDKNLKYEAYVERSLKNMGKFF